MTLILMLASEDQVHMTCDFKLTDARTGKPLSFDAHKLVPVAQGSLQAVVGVTGLATLDGENVGSPDVSVGRDHAARPGRGGQSPPRVRSAMAMSDSGLRP